jgi:LacI family transcriptional regulator
MRRRGKSVTLRDIAEALNINISTVSRALDPQCGHSVSSRLQNDVKAAAERLGYRPNAAAYSLKTSRSRTIGVIIPDITDPVFPPMIRGIEAGLERHEFIAVLANTDGDPIRERKVIDTLTARGVDGFIMASLARKDSSAKLLMGKRPVVTVSRTVEGTGFATVVHDEAGGINRLVTHLLALGHRSFATIAGPQSVSTGFGRLQALKGSLNAIGQRLPELLVATAERFTEEAGEHCAEQLLATNRRFSALICANDRLAIGALTTLQRHGLRCPEQVSVTGINDMAFASRLQPPLTTVKIQHRAAGLEAAETIVALLSGDTLRPRRIVLATELVIRGSTGSVPQPRRFSANQGREPRSSGAAQRAKLMRG